ncbi:hypothetical protein [Chryseobacterium sp.]|uniref:hypothetical protein n=1 Tax=Chryseobacterium sp. TaxID=1871047 RepID=UPI00388EEAEE
MAYKSEVNFRISFSERVLPHLNGKIMNDSQTGYNFLHLTINLDNVERCGFIKGPA